MTDTIRFTAEVNDMYGNINLEQKSEAELYQIIQDTYDIPQDCIKKLNLE